MSESDPKNPEIPKGWSEPMPGFVGEVNKRKVEADIAGGVYAKSLKTGEQIQIRTQNTIYLLEKREDGLYISGHHEFCPTPTLVKSLGSTYGGTMIKSGFIGRTMFLELYLEGRNGPIETSAIKDISPIPQSEK